MIVFLHYVAVICIILGMFFTNLGFSSLRFTIYLIVLIAPLYLFFPKYRLIKDSFFFQNFIVIVIVSFISIAILNIHFNFRNFANLIFIFAPIFYFYLFSSCDVKINLDFNLKLIFYSLISIYLLALLKNGQFQLFSLNLLSSNSDSENWLSFLFGMFSIYFIGEKDYKHSIISLILLLISFKRIAIIAVIIVVGINLFIPQKKWCRRTSYLMVTVNYLVIFFLFLFANNILDPLFFDFIGISPNLLSMGRQEIYSNIIDKLGYFSLAGYGIGSVDHATPILYKDFMRAHSDLLKNYYEFGSLMFGVWIYFLYKQYKGNTKIFPLILYLNILFITDNVFTYVDIMFCFYLIVLTLNRGFKVT